MLRSRRPRAESAAAIIDGEARGRLTSSNDSHPVSVIAALLECRRASSAFDAENQAEACQRTTVVK